MASKLRPECGSSSSNTSIPDDTALFLIRDSVARRRTLAYGRLHDNNGRHCAMGCFWEDNPKLSPSWSLLEEVAAVNDSLPRTATPQQRWKKVMEWLRFKTASLATAANRGVAK